MAGIYGVSVAFVSAGVSGIFSVSGSVGLFVCFVSGFLVFVFLFLFVYVCVCLSIYLPIYLVIHMPIYLSNFLSSPLSSLPSIPVYRSRPSLTSNFPRECHKMISFRKHTNLPEYIDIPARRLCQPQPLATETRRRGLRSRQLPAWLGGSCGEGKGRPDLGVVGVWGRGAGQGMCVGRRGRDGEEEGEGKGEGGV